MKLFLRSLTLAGWAMLAAALVKFGWELVAGTRAGLSFGAAAADASKRMVMGPVLGDQIFFYIAVLGAGLLLKSRMLRKLQFADRNG